MKKTILALLFFAGVAAQAQNRSFEEPYRPAFHFTPALNWCNDPNGLVYLAGEYHLFFQYNPYGNRWGHMSWGHATSKDLVHWKHQGLAIPEADGTMIFSGSAVIDESNSSGLFLPDKGIPMVAIYTGNTVADSTKPDNSIQAQWLAFSLDSGKTFTKYPGNPILDLKKKDFRDPGVFWYAPQKKWVMATVLPQQHIVQLYGSSNLISWNLLSEFGPAGDIKDIWECPSLVQVPVVNSDKKKWVLFNSQQTTMQYFVGEFDGTHFTNETPANKIMRPDFGPDFYAGITYNHLPEGHAPVLLGWANNWTYANDIPTNPWKSMMGIPRELSLIKRGNEFILLQRPTAGLDALRHKPWTADGVSVSGEKVLPVHGLQNEVDVDWQPATTGRSGLLLARGPNNQLIIGYDADRKVVFLDRKKAGDSSFNARFGSMSYYEAPITLKSNRLHFQVYIDQSIAEVFANDGEVVMSVQFFPNAAHDGISLFSDKAVVFSNVKVWKMNTIWR